MNLATGSNSHSGNYIPSIPVLSSKEDGSWSPDDSLMRSAQELVKLASEAKDTASQQRVWEHLELIRGQTDFTAALSDFLVHDDPEQWEYAGLILRAEMRRISAEIISERAIEFMQKRLFQALGSLVYRKRKLAANVSASLVLKFGLDRWPSIVNVMIGNILDIEDNLLEGILYTLSLVSEDSIQELEGIFLEDTMDNLICILEHKRKSSYLIHALNVILNLLPRQNNSCLSDRLGDIVKVLLALKDHRDDKVKKNIALCFCFLMEINPIACQEYSGLILEAMTSYLLGDESIAILAIEFLSVYSRNEFCQQSFLICKLSNVIPLILKRMESGDSAQDENGDDDIEEEEEDEEEEDEEYDENDDVMNWSIRKYCIQTLQTLSEVYYGPDFWPIIHPLILEHINSSSNSKIEVGLLALGTICQGKSFYDMEPEIPTLLKEVLRIATLTKSRKVKMACCWVLSQFHQWICSAEHEHEFLSPILEFVCSCAKVDIGKLRFVACQALEVFLNSLSEQNLECLTTQLLDSLRICLIDFRARNSLPLFSAVCTLLKRAEDLTKSPPINILLQPVLLAAALLKNSNDPKLIYALNTLRIIFESELTDFDSDPCLGECFEFVYGIACGLMEVKNEDCVPGNTFLDSAIFGTSLTLIGLIYPKIQNPKPNIYEGIRVLLKFSISSDSEDILSGAFRILRGILRKPNTFMDILPELVDFSVQVFMSTDIYSLSIESSRVIGDCVELQPELISPYLVDVVGFIAQILHHEEFTPLACELSLVLGQIAQGFGHQLSSYSLEFLDNWICHLSVPMVIEERTARNAVLGVVSVATANPSLQVISLDKLIQVSVLSKRPSKVVVDQICDALAMYRNNLHQRDLLLHYKLLEENLLFEFQSKFNVSLPKLLGL